MLQSCDSLTLFGLTDRWRVTKSCQMWVNTCWAAGMLTETWLRRLIFHSCLPLVTGGDLSSCWSHTSDRFETVSDTFFFFFFSNKFISRTSVLKCAQTLMTQSTGFHLEILTDNCFLNVWGVLVNPLSHPSVSIEADFFLKKVASTLPFRSAQSSTLTALAESAAGVSSWAFEMKTTGKVSLASSPWCVASDVSAESTSSIPPQCRC